MTYRLNLTYNRYCQGESFQDWIMDEKLHQIYKQDVNFNESSEDSNLVLLTRSFELAGYSLNHMNEKKLTIIFFEVIQYTSEKEWLLTSVLLDLYI